MHLVSKLTEFKVELSVRSGPRDSGSHDEPELAQGSEDQERPPRDEIYRLEKVTDYPED